MCLQPWKVSQDYTVSKHNLLWYENICLHVMVVFIRHTTHHHIIFSADELEKDLVVINFTWIKDALLREGWVVDGVMVTLRLKTETTMPLIDKTTLANHGIILGQKVSGVEQNTWLIGPAFHLDGAVWV